MNEPKLDLAQFEKLHSGATVRDSLRKTESDRAALLAECKRQREDLAHRAAALAAREKECSLHKETIHKEREQIAELAAAATALRKHLTASELDDVPDAIWLPFTAALAKVKP